MNRRFKKGQKVVKGMPSAVLLSIVIHVGLFLLAGMLVVFTVVKKEEKIFTPPKAVERPKMKLKKPKVKVKKTSKPKPTTRIVTKVNRASMPEIQLPEMSGLTEGLSGGIGGFDMMPDLGELTVFGDTQTIGNDFVGTFYDFKRDRTGRDIPMDLTMFRHALKEFVYSGWNPSKLARYYQSPKKLYATSFMIPLTLSIIAPSAFGEPDTLGYAWMALYKGQLVHKEGITFRFRGFGDDVLLVRVNGELVLNACWPGITDVTIANFWQSTSADSRKYYLGGNKAVVGDWITLEAGVPLDMEVMIGEVPGGAFSSMLVVEVEGAKYEKNRQGGPILPMFKTAEPSHALMDAIYKDLVPGEASVTNGPIFCDYATLSNPPGGEERKDPDPPNPPESDPAENGMRTWKTEDGETFEAEFVTVLSEKAVLKDVRGRVRKIPLAALSNTDVEFIELAQPPELSIDFPKQSSQRILQTSPYNNTPPPRILDYVFGAKLKQTSAGSYNHELQAEFFAVGSTINGREFILLDHQKSSFMPTKENQRSHAFHGRTVSLISYDMIRQRRGRKYKGFLVVVTDSRGQIINHSASSKWLIENLENLRKLPVGAYMDKRGVRIHPTGPKPALY